MMAENYTDNKDFWGTVKQIGKFGRTDGRLTVYLDFDGTLVEHRFPEMGAENEGWQAVVAKLQNAGHTVVLNTMRADIMADRYAAKQPVTAANPDYMQQAESWLAHKSGCLPAPITSGGLKLPPAAWVLQETYMRLHSIVFLDDQALGVPLRACKHGRGMMLDWTEIDRALESWGCYALPG